MSTERIFPTVAFHRWAAFAGLCALLLVGGGCGGSAGLYSMEPARVAERSLPAVRHTRTHPDSLRRLSIVEEEARLRVQLTTSYQRMHELWSSSFRFASARSGPRQPLTYATLWSKELSLASLEAEEGISSLTKEQARSLIEKRREAYQKTLRIDVYWFSGPDGTSITGPGARVRLHDGQGNAYAPVRERDSPLRNAFLLGRSSVLYRRNTFYFRRTVDGRDLLDGVDDLRLTVSPAAAPTVEFLWSWERR